MRAWYLPSLGFDHLTLTKDHPVPEIKNDHDILVKNIAVGINPADYKRCSRDEPPFSSTPFLIGCDGCGIIEKIGSAVDSSEFPIGKLVYYLTNTFQNGCFSEYTIQDSRAISTVPEKALEGKPMEEVATTFASLPVAAFTAYTNVCVKLRLPIFPVPEPSNPKIYKNIVVTGASGGVGGFALQLLSLWRKTLPEDVNKEIRIIAICSEKNHEFAKSLGATHAVDYSNENLVESVFDLTNKEGVDAFFDNTGGTTINWAFEVMNNGGDYVTNLAVPPAFDMSKLFFKSQNVHSTYLPHMYLKNLPYQLKELKEISNIVGKLVAEGKIKSTVTEVIKFAEIKDQLMKTAQFHSKGKVVALL